MERTFLLLVAFIFSSGQCQINDPSGGRSASLAVCQPDSCALISDLSAMRERLSAVMRTQDGLLKSVRSLGTEMAASQAKLGLCSTQMQELNKLNQGQAQQLKSLQESTSAAVPRVAFSAALGISIGPFETDTPIKYQQILSNMGSSYNPTTGTFTTLVPGMYYFRYSMFNNQVGKPNSVVALMKNNVKMVTTWDTEGDDSHDSASNAVVLKLEAGDTVFAQLWAQRVLYDDVNYYNTFSGFLLFPL